MAERDLRRKLRFHAHGATLILIKRPIESTEHVLQKAVLWALYLPDYPNLRVEVHLPGPSRYKPDLLALNADRPIFWGECGVVSHEKLADLLRRYRGTHFVFSKYGRSASGFSAFANQIEHALQQIRRTAPVELLRLPDQGTFANEHGDMLVTFDDIERRRWEP